MVEQRRSRHGDRVWYEVDDGSVHTLPRAWTSLADPHPFDVISAGRAPFRTEDLIRLAALLKDIQRRDVDLDGSHEV